MANLIEQMNVLKGLSDEHLQTELKTPTGEVPPFLVAGEINRRKDMRQRYESEQARRAPRTTVADDLVNGNGGLPAAVPPQQGGAALGAMPPGAAPGVAPTGMAGPQRSFASGGIVDAVNYNDIAQRLNQRLTGLTADTKRAQALALIRAGAGIMGAGHSNTLQNVGIGIDQGVNSYSDALKSIDSEEVSLLSGLTNIGQAQHSEELQRLQQESIDRRAGEQLSMDRERLNFEKTPAAVLEEQWYNAPTTTDAERASFDQHKRYGNPYGLAQSGDDFRAIEEQTRVSMKDKDPSDPKNLIYNNDIPLDANGKPDAQAVAQAQAQFEKAIKIETYKRIQNAYGNATAARYALNAGLTVQDTTGAANDTLATGATPPAGADPLGLGL